MYFIPSIINGEFHSYISSFGKIVTAAEKWDEKRMTDKAVHDSHIKSSTEGNRFPEELEKQIGKDSVDVIYNNMKDILGKVNDVIVKNPSYVKKYDEIKNGYSFFGVDFMVDKNNKVYLIEINGSNTGISATNPAYNKSLSKQIFGSVLKAFVDPVFFGKKQKLGNFDRL